LISSQFVFKYQDPVASQKVGAPATNLTKSALLLTINSGLFPLILTTPLARFLSTLFHPLLMPTWVFGVLLYAAPGAFRNLAALDQTADVGLGPLTVSVRIGLMYLVFVGTFLVPALGLYWLHRFGVVKSLALENRQDRRVPYLMTAAVYTILTIVFGYRLKLLPEVSLILGSITLAIIGVVFVNLFWQISAHGVGLGGAVGALAGVLVRFGEASLFPTLLLSILLTGWVLAARLHLNAHTPAQVGAGWGLGLVVSLGAVVWGL
jgi:hypothetical protein